MFACGAVVPAKLIFLTGVPIRFRRIHHDVTPGRTGR
jgi:hypothetical protein